MEDGDRTRPYWKQGRDLLPGGKVEHNLIRHKCSEIQTGLPVVNG